MKRIPIWMLPLVLAVVSDKLMALEGVVLPPIARPPAPVAPDFNRAAMLRAIGAVQTRNEPAAIGGAGERSEWQLMEYVWREHIAVPFEWATILPELAERVAREHLEKIVARLARAGRAVTPFAVAREWNPHAPRDEWERTANLYFELTKPQGKDRP